MDSERNADRPATDTGRMTIRVFPHFIGLRIGELSLVVRDGAASWLWSGLYFRSAHLGRC